MLHSLFAQAVQPAPGAWYDEPWFMVASVLVILIVPYLLGEMISRKLRMPDYGWKIGLILIALVAGVVIDVVRWPPRLGIDLSGGVKLIYQLDQSQLRAVNVDKLVERLAKEANKAGGFGKKKADATPIGEGQLEIKLPSNDVEKARKVEDAIAKLDLKTDLGVTLSPGNRRTTDAGITLVYQADHVAGTVDMDKLISAVIKRVNPGGQREVAIRKVGTDQIEVAIPNVEKAEVEQIKKKISTAGALEFRIVADSRIPEHVEAIEAAERGKKNPSNEVSNGQEIVGEWVDLSDNVKLRPTWASRKTATGKMQVLVMRDRYDVTGGYLTNARMGLGEKGVEVHFEFNSEGARRFGEFTGSNLPDPVSNQERELAIVLDKTLMSAANIQSRISDNGRITGVPSEAEVTFIVEVLNAGALPAALQKDPVSENGISAELGQDTIRNSALSMIVSTAAVLLFMLFYYRFAGIVANAAVLMNLLLVLALMIVFKAAFTLAGLAGLVLSVGMAVDSNVLIYERMREEKERGAALRMVIRNGFGRAMATIIDTHATTIITGIVLFAIGTEQLRGFAVTLVMGLVVNLFTAVFCARVVFDIAERQRWLKELKMLKLFGETKIDFVSIMKPAIAISILISLAGVAAVIHRGKSILDVDFTGGSEVQIVLNREKAMDVSEVRKTLEKPEVAKILPDATVNAVTTAAGQENTQFVIRTSNDKLTFNDLTSDDKLKGVKDVESELANVFGDHLRHYKVTLKDLHKIEATAAAIKENAAAPAAPGASSTTGTQSPKLTAPPPRLKETPKDEGKAPPADATPKTPTDSTDKPSGTKTPGDTNPDATKPSAPSSGKSGTGADAQKTDEKPAAPVVPKQSVHLQRLDRMLLAFAPLDVVLSDDQPAATTTTATPEAKHANTTTTPPTTLPSSPEAPKNFATRGLTSAGADPFVGGTAVMLQFDDPIKFESLSALIEESIDTKKVPYEVSNPEYSAGSKKGYTSWSLKLSIAPEEASPILASFADKLAKTPVFLADSKIGSRVAAATQWTAIEALVASIVMIVLYIWIRFQNVIYGIGAVVALIHDVLVTVAGVALSYYVAGFLGFLLVDPFKISLNVVAAMLTIVGYSISDTIVIFDRIREVRGKSPDLTEEMINKSVNQTLSRTVLTVFTVLLVTIILYIAGGQAIHAFAFTMLIGLISGTYSSVYIAAPCLLWLKLPGGENNK